MKLICVICDSELVQQSSSPCFPPIWDDSVRWWILLWGAADIFLSLLQNIMKPRRRCFQMWWSASDRTTVSTSTPGMNSNTSRVRWQQEKTRGRASTQARHLHDHRKSSTQQKLSCIEFHTGVGRTNLETCVSSSGPERIVNKNLHLCIRGVCVHNSQSTPYTFSIHF